MVTAAAYGSWTSPLTPDSFSKGNCKAICELQATSSGVFWVEQSASTGKRELYFKGAVGDRVRWAPEQSVQNAGIFFCFVLIVLFFVHEYGGGSFMPTEEGSVVYSTVEGLYEQATPEAAPVQLANGVEKTFRFADFAVTATHVFCVNETHQVKGQDPENRLISVDRRTKNQQVIASGADFYSCPRISPDGKKIIWMQWNHINMPWDETSIHAGVVHEDGTVTNETTLKDGVGKNINYNCPSWSPTGELYVVHDATNFWNVYKVDPATGEEKNVYPVEKEIGNPQWNFGDRPYATNSKGMIFRVGDKLYRREGDVVLPIDLPGFTYFSHLTLTEDGIVYTIACGPAKPSTLLKITNWTEVEVIREARDPAELAQYDISEPEVLEFNSDGHRVCGYFYPPKNRSYEGTTGTLPPVILMGHGGPTAAAWPVLDMKKQFFTSRGFAIFDVDYRGSTSYGSEFRHMLKRQWGIVDRNDMINGAKMLIESGKVDAEKVCIMGSSAGGYLVLNALIHSDVFKAAVSIYGVGDLVGLAKDTHKFERGYNEALLGKYPEEAAIYDERSPINHIDKLKVPTAFLHGKEDTVVPVGQSIEMYEKLREKGVVTALQLYENEGHGFRGAEAVRKSNEAAYYFLCKAIGIKPSLDSELEIVNLSQSRI